MTACPGCKTELDNRDEKIQATLNMLHDSITKLGA